MNLNTCSDINVDEIKKKFPETKKFSEKELILKMKLLDKVIDISMDEYERQNYK